MAICLFLAAAVLGLVAIPARQEGRMVLTEQGEAFTETVKDKAATVKDKADSVRQSLRR